MYRTALRVAKIIKARMDYHKLSANKLTKAYIDKRTAISAAAKTGNINYFL